MIDRIKETPVGQHAWRLMDKVQAGLAEMGKKGREIAESRYDVHKVNLSILRPMELDQFHDKRNVARWSPVSKSSKA